ncbi:MAG: MMPL family transporter [Bdellovibrionota bacterium]
MAASRHRIAKVFALAWLAVVVACFAVLWKRDFGASAIETDILELLPPTSRSAIVNVAVKKFATQISDRALIVVEANTFESAQSAAELYADALESSGAFSEVRLRVDTEIERALKSLYYPHRFQLLTPDVRKQLQSDSKAVSELIEYVEQVLTTPVSGGITDFLPTDPLLFFPRFLANLGRSLGRTTIRDGMLVSSHDGNSGIIIIARLKGGAFAREVQQSAVVAFSDASAKVNAAKPNVKIFVSGIVRYAEKAARAAESELQLISIGSLIGVVVLMLGAYRALTPLILMLVTIVIGCAAALAAALLWFTKVHMITLGFGASLIGVGVDHGFHFFSFQAFGPERSRFEVLRAIFPGIFLGILTTILGFLGLVIAPFPGLNQIAFFSIVGLTAAFFTVVLWYPFLSTVRRGNPDNFLFRWIRRWLALWSSGSPIVVGLTAATLLFTAYGVLRARVDDDVRLLEGRDEALRQEDNVVSSYIGGTDTSRFFIVSGDTPQEVLAREEALTESLLPEQPPVRFQALSQFIPSVARQKDNEALLSSFLARHGAELRSGLSELGMEDEAINLLLSQPGAFPPPLDFDTFTASAASEPVRQLWLGSAANRSVSLVTVAEGTDTSVLDRAATRIPGVFFVDRVRDTSNILAEHRVLGTETIVLFYLLVLVVLIHRYGIRAGVTAFLPAVLAGAICIAGCGLSNQPVNLFSVLAILIVLGLGIDFAVFLLEGEHEIEATMFAVLLSALSTLLSLALLALCSAPVLRSFGQSMFLGTGAAMVFAPVVLYRPRTAGTSVQK